MIVESIKLPHFNSEDMHHSCRSQLAWNNIARQTPVSDVLYLVVSLYLYSANSDCLFLLIYIFALTVRVGLLLTK
jgi:hypothetical protein